MGEHKHHATAVANVPRLPEPQVCVHVLQDGEQGVILGKSDGKFDRSAVEIGQKGAASARLRFVWVGVGIGGVIVESEPVH